MNLPAGFTRSQYQAAMPARVLRIVLNDLSPQDDTTHLLHTNHPIWPGHLSDRMGKKKQLLPSGSVDQGRDFAHKTVRAEFDCTQSTRAAEILLAKVRPG